MKITIVVGGKFHGFNLAEQLNNKSVLKSLITSYPKYSLQKHGIEKEKVKSLLFKEILLKIFNKINYFFKYFDYDFFLCNYFDQKASKLIDYQNTDILIGWSGFSKECFLKAQKYKCIKILERGSSHIRFQEQILKEEYSKTGINHKIPSKKIIDKEIQEYDLADYICVPSQFVKDSFLKFGINEKKIIKIPYGVDLKEFEILKNLKSKNDKFKIICTGTVCIRKGSHYLIKAFDELALPEAELIFVGPIEKEINEILKKFKNNKNIKFIGKKPQGELKYLYNSSDLFVLNSIEDGFGMVISQAMACGLPVIATENAGGSEIIEDGVDGFIVPVRNNSILKKKISELYFNREKLLEMGTNAYKKSLKDLSWENYGNKMFDTYYNLLKNRLDR